MRSIQSRLEAASATFEDKDLQLSYLSALRDNWRYSEGLLRKSYTLWLLTAAVYTLLQSHGVGALTLGPVNVKNIDLVQKALPIVLAALNYSIVAFVTQNAIYEAVHDKFIKRFLPDLYHNDLEQALHPPGSVVSGESSTFPFFPGRTGTLLFSVLAIKNFTIVLLPLVLTVAAIMSLLLDFGGRDPVAVLSAGLATLFCMYAIAITFGFARFYFSER